jgi:hypothetical protein
MRVWKVGLASATGRRNGGDLLVCEECRRVVAIPARRRRHVLCCLVRVAVLVVLVNIILFYSTVKKKDMGRRGDGSLVGRGHCKGI